MTETTQTPNLTERALLVSLNLSVWTARKFDRAVTEETNRNAHADARAGRYNKHLLAGAEQHKAITKIAAKARVAHYSQTLPWADSGWRLLPTKNYFKYQETMRELQNDFRNAVSEFLQDYPQLKQEAAALLGDLYVAEDYPDTDSIKGKFRWAVEYSPIPDSQDIRVELGDGQVAQIQSSITDRVQRATQEAIGDAWERLHKTVSHVQASLSEPDKIFRNSLIGNIEELVDLLTRLNVTDDPNLEAMRKRVEAELSLLDPEDLRKDKDLRAETAKQAGEIVDAMSQFFSPPSN